MRIHQKTLQDGVASRRALGGSTVPPADTDNLVINVIRAAISEAQDAHQLLRISRVAIPQAMGITSEQRRALQILVTDKFSKLNAEAGYGNNHGKRKF